MVAYQILYKSIRARTAIYTILGLYLIISFALRFLPSMNGPGGGLIISIILLVMGYRSAKEDIAEYKKLASSGE